MIYRVTQLFHRPTDTSDVVRRMVSALLCGACCLRFAKDSDLIEPSDSVPYCLVCGKSCGGACDVCCDVCRS
jgi:hypothetical protein